jgi:hypothetical protein
MIEEMTSTLHSTGASLDAAQLHRVQGRPQPASAAAVEARSGEQVAATTLAEARRATRRSNRLKTAHAGASA